MALPNIVHVVNSVQHGGAERVVLDLATAQHGTIGQCQVVCLHVLGELEPEFHDRGIGVTVLPPAARGAVATAWHLAGVLRTASPRVVHAHNVAPQIAVPLSRRMRRWGDSATRLVYTEHGRLADPRATLLALRRWAGRDLDAVVGVSVDVRDQLLQLRVGRRDRVHVVRNGVNLDRFTPHSPASTDLPIRLLSIGRLSHIKGQDVLLQAIALARPRLGEARLTLVGDGPMRADLEAQVDALGLRDVVEFAGAQRDVAPFLHRADIFLLPSRSEGISLALLEAMACGLPVIGTVVGGTPEVTGTGQGAILVPPEQPEAMAEALVTMLSDRGRIAREGSAARRRVEEAFSLSATVAAYSTLYGLDLPGATG